jgi:transcriptional regulator with XRE-family HTH domain
MRQVNRNLKAVRALRGLTQNQLAQRIGKSQAWVCQLEKGEIEPSALDVALICRALNVHPQEVFPGGCAAAGGTLPWSPMNASPTPHTPEEARHV